MLNLNWKVVGSAILSAVIVAILGYLGTLTNIFDANLTQILNIALLTGITSLLKALGTNTDGKFLGSIQIK